jgi:hypothetical protein
MEVAGANRRWRCQFRYRGSRRESAVAQLFSLGVRATRLDFMSDPQFSKSSKEDLEHLIHSTQPGSPLFTSASYELQKRQSEKMTHEMKRAADASKHSHKAWYERPLGLIAIGVAIFIVTALLAHFFPQWFHS